MEHTKQPEKTTPIVAPVGSKVKLPSVKEVVEEQGQPLLDNLKEQGRTIKEHQDSISELSLIMDTEAEKKSFKMLYHNSGIIYNNEEEVFYQVVFPEKRGKFTPGIVTSKGEYISIQDRLAEHMEERELDKNGNIKKYKKGDKKGEEKLKYDKASQVPFEERYHYFEYSGVHYQFSKRLKYNRSHKVGIISNAGIIDVVNGRKYTKEVFNYVTDEIKDYFWHKHSEEYDILATFPFSCAIYEALGMVYYLVMVGAPGTGKSVIIQLLSEFTPNGVYGGATSIPYTVRIIDGLGASMFQDEFEKMNKEAKISFIQVCNNGYNRGGCYRITKDITRDHPLDQLVSYEVFCPKAFTSNDLKAIDFSFLTRCYITRSILQAIKLKKRIANPTKEDYNRWDDLRSKIFVFCMDNWADIVKSIEEMKEEIEDDGLLGREADKNCIILGIIKYFKGKKKSDEIKEYLKEKLKTEGEEKRQTELEIILSFIVRASDCSPVVRILNTECYSDLLTNLGFEEGDKWAPSNQRPQKVLRDTGLYTKKSQRKWDSETNTAVYELVTHDVLLETRKWGFSELEKELEERIALHTKLKKEEKKIEKRKKPTESQQKKKIKHLFDSPGNPIVPINPLDLLDKSLMGTKGSNGDMGLILERKNSLNEKSGMFEYENTLAQIELSMIDDTKYHYTELAKAIDCPDSEWLNALLMQKMKLGEMDFLEADGKGNYWKRTDIEV